MIDATPYLAPPYLATPYLESLDPVSRIPWEIFHRIKERYPLTRPKLRFPYRELQALAVL
jgi:hypothetical protein